MAAEQSLTLAHLAIPLLGLLIPLVAIVAHYLTKALADRQRHQTIREFARAGQPVPPELLADVQPRRSSGGQSTTQGRDRVLLPAVVNLGLGLGLTGLFAAMQPGSWLWAIGLVPLGLGAGLLLLWLATRPRPPAP